MHCNVELFFSSRRGQYNSQVWPLGTPNATEYDMKFVYAVLGLSEIRQDVSFVSLRLTSCIPHQLSGPGNFDVLQPLAEAVATIPDNVTSNHRPLGKVGVSHRRGDISAVHESMCLRSYTASATANQQSWVVAMILYCVHAPSSSISPRRSSQYRSHPCDQEIYKTIFLSGTTS
jgi:hypothetical protein